MNKKNNEDLVNPPVIWVTELKNKEEADKAVAKGLLVMEHTELLSGLNKVRYFLYPDKAQEKKK